MTKIEPEYEQDSQWADPHMVQIVMEFVDILHRALSAEQLEDPEDVKKLYEKIHRQLIRKHKIDLKKATINRVYTHLVKQGKMAPSYIIEVLTTTKSVRSQSGVLPISVATDGNNFSCAYDCYFCPDERKEKGAPRDISRSYLSSEGTFIRGAIEDFEPAGQVWRRLLELELMGHPPDKCEMIILGGTWDSYDAEYRDYFIHQLFYACNVFHKFSLRMHGELSHLTKEWANQNPFTKGMAFDPERKIKSLLRPPMSLEEEKKENESAPCARVIGIVLETRPDQISKASLLRKRRLGCTRIQLGVQHTDDQILKLNNRGHGVDKSIAAIQCARDAGFKVDGHLMPDLPGTTAEKDMDMLREVFGGESLQLDYCKLYPCLDLPYTVTREWKEQGVWKPMAEHNFPVFLDILRYAMSIVPPWTRVNRVHRDFPEAQEKNNYLGFVSENIRSNLQQMVMAELKKHGQSCYDIRTREIKNAYPIGYESRARLFVRCYRANEGTEFFITVEIPNKKHSQGPDDALLMGLLRLRLTDIDVRRLQGEEHVKVPFHYLPEFARRPIARIRELHVYGKTRMVSKANESSETNSQHTGVGKFLMAVAERIARAYGHNELSVISGVGVREYYRRLGYEMDSGKGEYLVKDVSDAARMLPASLFGRVFADSDIVTPLSQLKIPLAYLPPANLAGMTARARRPTVPWYSVHNYNNIQNGLAQLIILDVPQMDTAGSSQLYGTLLWMPAILAALVAMLCRYYGLV